MSRRAAQPPWNQRITAAPPPRNHPATAAPPPSQEAGRLVGVVTQNIDGLHQQAGCTNVHELHGTVHRIECAGCRNGGIPERTMYTSGGERMMNKRTDDRCGWSGPSSCCNHIL